MDIPKQKRLNNYNLGLGQNARAIASYCSFTHNRTEAGLDERQAIDFALGFVVFMQAHDAERYGVAYRKFMRAQAKEESDGTDNG